MHEIFLALPSIILIGTANALLKWRIVYLNQQGVSIFSPKFFSFLFDPYIFCGALATLLAILWWLNIISSVRIGVIYPIMQAGSIIFTLILSVFFLNETVSTSQFLAILFIVIGLIILTSTT